jgi:hypothetical protein
VRADGSEGRSEPAAVHVDGGAVAAPVHLVLVETPFVRGRLELGGRSSHGVWLLLQGSQTIRLVTPQEGGTFAFTHLESEVFTLTVQHNSRDLPIEPSTLDLRNGPLRDVVVRIVEPAAAEGR